MTSRSNRDTPRPAEICRQLLAAWDASEGQRRRRKRDTRPDVIGMRIKRRLLENAVTADPDPDGFEGWLLEQCLAGLEIELGRHGETLRVARGSCRAMAKEILAEWEMARTSGAFGNWLREGARSDDARDSLDR